MICGLVVGKINKYEFRLYLQNLSGICKPNRKKVTGLLRSGEAKKFKKFQIVVKLWSNNGQSNYSRILVLLNNYFSFFKTLVKSGQTVVKQWSNNGQTNYSRNISVTK